MDNLGEQGLALKRTLDVRMRDKLLMDKRGKLLLWLAHPGQMPAGRAKRLHMGQPRLFQVGVLRADQMRWEDATDGVRLMGRGLPAPVQLADVHPTEQDPLRQRNLERKIN